MRIRQSITAIGAGISTFLLVAVLVIELLDFEFSAIVGLPVGFIAGLAVLILLAIQFDDIGQIAQHAASAYAAFGIAILVLFGARYVNLGPSRDVLSVDVMLGVSTAVGLFVFVALWLQYRTTSGRPKRT